MQSSGGVLRINVVHGKLTKDLESFGKQDPYVKITYMGTPYKTRVHENGGKNPVWNQAFDIRIGSIGDDMQFEVKDEDVVGAKLIGQATIKASSFCINGGVRDYFTFTDKHGKSVG
jgi:Ca2+-dependent lipid-binding protein